MKQLVFVRSPLGVGVFDVVFEGSEPDKELVYVLVYVAWLKRWHHLLFLV